MWISGDSDVILLAKRNESWAHVIDPGQSARPAPEHAGGPLRRSGVEETSSTSTAGSSTINGEVERLFKFHMEKLGAA